MKFKIIHDTSYQFTSKIFLEPHYLRLKPKYTPHQTLQDFTLTISPKPVGLSLQVDEESNLIHFCWFDVLTDLLHIRSASIVGTEPYNPFNFITYPGDFLTLPFAYSGTQKNILKADLDFDRVSPPLIDYGKRILADANFETLTFIINLTRAIHSDFTIIIREEGPPHRPDEAFELKEGSCRDLTWMQINLLRCMGVAARFVSGYFYLPDEVVAYELHAWLEVFLPGGGWIGFDPSHGVATGYTHIPIVSSSHYEHTMPVTGTIRGDADSTLLTRVSIETID